ncbi:MAG: 3-methyl-2-oxobutanoate dehydrogenase subunit VorB [Desulfuromonas sp.]|nr:MAG: 3-methyl-2-oxobutanoate dehydrogenase subunit VorB [Desulfuromonas sp.]
MSERQLVAGNIAVAMGALAAGCRHYFGYPITPQSDIPAYMSAELRKLGGTFIQAESEIASINMLLGASACGFRAMTSSSSPGISLKQEGISYMAGSELPGLIVNICRSGPGLGGIDASQADYFQSVKTGGHGGYRTIVVAPASVQEMYDLTILSFDLSDRYRMPALLLADSLVGQMKEALELKPYTLPSDLPAKEWAVTGKLWRSDQRIVKSLYLGEGELEQHNWKLWRRAEELKEKEQRSEGKYLDDAKLIVTGFGSAARIAKTAVEMAREAGMQVGFLRPITLFPFPEKAFAEATVSCKQLLCVELSTGQMVEDVRLSVARDAEVAFYGRPPGTGSLPTPEELFAQIQKHYGKGA